MADLPDKALHGVQLDFWRGKRVLVTGGEGFVGARLAQRLVEAGAGVTAAVRRRRPSAVLDLICTRERRPDTVISDLSDFAAVQRLCGEVDAIFHLAASAILGEAARIPHAMLVNNIVPTLNLLEAARLASIPRVVIASSDKVYGDHSAAGDGPPFVETHALRGLDIYGASKLCADTMGQAYALRFALPVRIARSCNVFGPGDLNLSRLIPRTILRLQQGLPPVLDRAGAQVLREYIYIDDLIEAYLFLAAAPHAAMHDQGAAQGPQPDAYGASAYNVGANSRLERGQLQRVPFDLNTARNIHTGVDVAQRIAAAMGAQGTAIREKRATVSAPDGAPAPHQYLDSSKLAALGFSAATGFAQGLDSTIAWYRANAEALARIGKEELADADD